MRILFDSKKTEYKAPFGTVTPNEKCTLHIHIPVTVPAVFVECIFSWENGSPAFTVPMTPVETRGSYQVYRGEFSIPQPGLYFYHFRVEKPHSSFRLYKAGDGTNMEAGDCWQLSCIPADFTTPDWAKGAVIYQVFPDRFCKSGDCDLTGKLTPYTLHENWDEEVAWQPTPEGQVLNNDFYGGNFRGITEKMDYIASLGTTILYLNPICKSFSSHRYDTGDYKTPDPMLGTIDDFKQMCQAAHSRGIRVILDGVFSHTGANSLYFDRERTFGGKGAYCTTDSPYYSWYNFQHHPDTYTSWWGFDTLPTVNKMDPGFISYVITGEDSVVEHWLKLGADGFRLDVADELPNEFIKLLKDQIRKIRPDALLIGEVWEDASNKVAYDVRRRYFVDSVLDSAMNYPFRTAILNFMKGIDNGQGLRQTVETIRENYPPQVFLCNMNLLGTHDTPRIRTALVDDFDGSREALARRFLSKEQKDRSKKMLMLASFLQYMLPGAPSLYYGDEAGMEGGKDPFNRRTYPWGGEDNDLLEHFRQLGSLRKNEEVLRLGDVEFQVAENQKLSFTRAYQGRRLQIYVNRSEEVWDIPGKKVLYGRSLNSISPGRLSLAPMDFCLMEV
ncbi:MAG: glycoside hydrolase family 13 protein [Oscillospiraceae bacterium]|nr:glycoside hydrolase family 13 protein [Oscillospiraceae bacterium]